jgi:hypothetical protein
MVETATNPTANESGESARRQGHEPNALNMTFLWSVVGGLLLLVLIAMIFMKILLDSLAEQGRAPAGLSPSLSQVRPLPVEPSLDPNQKQHLEEIRASEAKVLSSYAWLDEERGLARIPIERAMELLIKEGLPEPKETPASTEKKDNGAEPNAEKKTQ